MIYFSAEIRDLNTGLNKTRLTTEENAQSSMKDEEKAIHFIIVICIYHSTWRQWIQVSRQRMLLKIKEKWK